MIKGIRYALGAVAAMAATSATAVELSREALEHVMGACRADYHRVCDDVVPGDGRVGRCLLNHERQLSPQCLKAVKLAFAVEACSRDYDRYCRGAQKGAESIRCLSQRLPVLAPECRRVIEANAGGPARGGYGGPQAAYGAPYPSPYGNPYAPPPPPYSYGGAPRSGDPYGYPQGPGPNGGGYDGRYAEGAPDPYAGPGGPSPYGARPPYGDGGQPPQGYYGDGQRPPYGPAPDDGRD
jgi:hypothetical protein